MWTRIRAKCGEKKTCMCSLSPAVQSPRPLHTCPAGCPSMSVTPTPPPCPSLSMNARYTCPPSCPRRLRRPPSRQKMFQIWVSTSVTSTPLTRIVPNMGVHVGYADPPTRIGPNMGVHVGYAGIPSPEPSQIWVSTSVMPTPHPRRLHKLSFRDSHADPPSRQIVPNMGVHVGYADIPHQNRPKYGCPRRLRRPPLSTSVTKVDRPGQYKPL